MSFPSLTAELFVKARRLDETQRREAACHGNGVARERARLVDRTAGRDLFHDVAAPAEGGNGHAAADHLTEHRDVGRDVKERLRAAQGHAEARHHFVNDEKRAVFGAEAAHRVVNSCVPRTRFMLPANASTITHAMSSPH